jgi:hypothetical protein
MRGSWVHEPLLRGLLSFIPRDRKIMDIGCGPGHYVSALQSVGYFNVKGVDGTPRIDIVSHGVASQADLTQPCTNLYRAADWGLCIEVGEHIYATHECPLLDNIASIAREGLVITWSTRPGYGHVNLRSEGYIAQRLGDRGWVVDDFNSQQLKNRLGRKFRSWVLVLRRD